jgi:CheY-like chemotaxis protein
MAHVLLIDDDPDVIQAHRVSEARSGQEGWEALLRATPDAIVLDVMMEEFTAGFTLAQDIRVKYPRLPIIMLTGVTAHMSQAWKFSQEGDGHWLPVHAFLEKPVNPDTLTSAVGDAIREAAQAPRSVPHGPRAAG